MTPTASREAAGRTTEREHGGADVVREYEAGTAEHPTRRPDGEPSVGELVSRITDDARRLLGQEIELAKAELKAEVSRAGQAGGMFGGAAFAGYMVAVFLSLAAVFGLANLMDPGWAALIVTAFWAVTAGALALLGRARTRKLSPKPEHTIDTLKEDARWARHPTHPTG